MKRQTRRFTFTLVSLLLLLPWLTACQPIAPPATTSQVQANRAVGQRFDDELVKQKQLAVFKEVFGSHIVPSHTGFDGGEDGHWNLTLLALDAPAASVCPTNVADVASYQQQATKVVGYLLGGENPFRGVGCNYSACANLAAEVSASQCVLSAAVPGNVCGLQAGLITVECKEMASVESADATACAAQLDACFGVGVSGFFLPISNKTTAHVFELDPEPVTLTQDISSNNGATADGIYVNSGLNTEVVKWPSTSTGGFGLPPLGKPCTTGALGTGSTTNKVIVGTATLRKCM